MAWLEKEKGQKETKGAGAKGGGEGRKKDKRLRSPAAIPDALSDRIGTECL